MTSQQDVSTYPRRSGTRGRHAAPRQPVPADDKYAAVAQASEPETLTDAASAPVADLGAAPGRRLRLLHPLSAICALQVILSLTLIWSNTAFTDEADYLWIGRLVIANWIHGRSWPVVYGEKILPGSPLIYPPVGGLADSIGGLAGARVLSLIFMLATTILLYLTASRLAGRAAAVFAAAIWAFTEPVIRLAFATAEPLSIFLTALAAWLIVAAGHRRRHGEFVAAAAGALALANAATYTGVIIDPVLLAFAIFVWRPRLGARQAAFSTAWFAGAWFVFLGAALTFSRSWPGFTATLAAIGTSNHQSPVLVLTDIWTLAGLVVLLGLVGAVVAGGVKDAPLTGLMAVLGGAALIVPIVALASQSTGMLDRRLGYGLWFAAIAAGYGCAKLIRWLPAAGKPVTAAACAVLIGYLGFTAWQSARDVYRGWPDSTSFIVSFSSAAAKSDGLLFAASQDHIAEYYTNAGDDWTRWKVRGLTLNPPVTPTVAYYQGILGQANYGVIALFYTTPSSADEPGLNELTRALNQNPAYRPAGHGTYGTANSHGVYRIWLKVAAK